MGRRYLIERGRDTLGKVSYVAFSLGKEADHEDGAKSKGEVTDHVS